MRYASDFRAISRNSLHGKWTLAVIAGLLASLVGAIPSQGLEVKLDLQGTGASFALEFMNRQIFSTEGTGISWLRPVLLGKASLTVIGAIAVAVVLFAVGSIVAVGYARFNLELVDRKNEPEIVTLFSCFSDWKRLALTALLREVYTVLWSLLLIIPGIIAAYSYAMTPFILAENPTISPSEAIECSKNMMEGNRWRLFCLHVSFIGWSFLCALSLGIGNLWLTPYVQTSVAAFYRDVSGAQLNQ